jgi:signal peptidase I
MNPSNQPTIKSHNNKDPWLAVNLSKALPGVGQIYARKTTKGILTLIGHLLLTVIGLVLLLTNEDNLWAGFTMLILGLLVIPIWSLFDAHASARSGNSQDYELSRKQYRNGWLAVFLSIFIPGLGHAYIKQWFYAILFFTIFILLSFIPSSFSPFLGFDLLLSIFFLLIVMYHVYAITPVPKPSRYKSNTFLIIGLIGISLLSSSIFALSVRHFMAESRYIPSAAMIPTLQVNDRLIINKLIYRFSEPQRADII